MRIKRSVLLLTAAIFVGALIYVYNSYRVPVLMYHSINQGAEKSRLVVSPESFREQMRFLRENKYRILTMREYVGTLKKTGRVPRRSVVVTFDDGYKDNFTNAYPVLTEYAVPAVIFVVTDWVGNPDMMTWEDIRSISESGLIEIGSHSVTHCVLPEAELSLVETELKRSKRIIEDKIGKTVDFLCYPCGYFSPRIKELARDSGYLAACATHPGKETDLNDHFAIRRIRVSASADNLLVFRAQVSGYYDFLRDRRIKKK